ncbi:MAG: hypothetical protein JM58_06725 [Peptococcaceae bacterium BICA1-8]|nr:MAG: hypothetical protein JM58_06725 [Peptococcaceae bacterium BICA1-8]
MLKAFTRNYEDNSTEAGFQFTFYCDLCNDGFKSSFNESETYKKGSILRSISGGVSVLGGLFGGAIGNMASSAGHGSDILSERFTGMSPEWQKEHEQAFQRAQNEAQQHFHRCHGCRQWICDADYNEDEDLCVDCAPRENVTVAKVKANRMVREIEEEAEGAKVFRGKIESKTIICPVCGKPSGEGKFCNNCGANLSMNICPDCGTQVAKGVKFCGECGTRV